MLRCRTSHRVMLMFPLNSLWNNTLTPLSWIFLDANCPQMCLLVLNCKGLNYSRYPRGNTASVVDALPLPIQSTRYYREILPILTVFLITVSFSVVHYGRACNPLRDVVLEVMCECFYSAAALLATQSAVLATAIPSIRPSVCHTLVPYPDE